MMTNDGTVLSERTTARTRIQIAQPETAQRPAQRRILREADRLFRQGVSAREFIDEIYGEEGVVERLLPRDGDQVEFEQTDEGRQVRALLAGLIDNQNGNAFPGDHTKVITVRIPATVHRLLKEEAHKRQTSLNKLVVGRALLTMV